MIALIIGTFIGAIVAVLSEQYFKSINNKKNNERFARKSFICTWIFLDYCARQCDECEASDALQYVAKLALECIFKNEHPIKYRLGRKPLIPVDPAGVALTSEVFPMTYLSFRKAMELADFNGDQHMNIHVKDQWAKVLLKPEIMYL